MDNHIWFKKAQYGMMAHWGLYSLLAGEYRGRRSGNYAEWIQSDMAIPKDFRNFHEIAPQAFPSVTTPVCALARNDSG